MSSEKIDGRPCQKCGCTVRYAKDKGCVQCRQTKSLAKQREYREQIKEIAELRALLQEAVLCIRWDEEPELTERIKAALGN